MEKKRDLSKYLSVYETAVLLRVSESYIRFQIKNFSFMQPWKSAIKEGRKTYIPKLAIKKYLQTMFRNCMASIEKGAKKSSKRKSV